MTNDYLLGSDEAERERLLEHSAVHRPAAERLLDRIGIRPGAAVVDLGCGPLGLLDLLAERAGPTGRVLGLDADPRMIGFARQTLAAQDVTGVELRHGDATATELPDAAFDVVHARSVALHVRDPAALVAEMVRITRPGGYVLLQDIDGVSIACEPPHPAWDRLLGAVFATWRAVGVDVHIGRTLPGVLRAHGLHGVGVDVHARVWGRADLHQRVLLRFATALGDRLLGLGADERVGLEADVAAHLDAPGTLTYDALLVQTWGRRPG